MTGRTVSQEMLRHEDDGIFLTTILARIREKRGLDFSGYRRNLLLRRVMARVRLTKNQNFEEYLRCLDSDSGEIDKLLDALTINVTEFFRDPAVFDVIEKRVIPELFAGKEGRVKIWSCACSSGEEAYSLMMLMAEHCRTSKECPEFSILATDIDRRSLENAFHGGYGKASLKNLSARLMQILQKYFHIVDEGFNIREDISVPVEFRHHDIVSESPPGTFDMILCRNMLMYLDREQQRRVLEKFYEALNPGGFLVLGIVESTGGSFKERFAEYDIKSRIYLKI
jgi:chemotaxis protein methyltransferase CheR